MSEAINPWLHVVAAAVWVGPQFMLFIAAIPAIRTIEDAQTRGRAMRVLTTRFGYLAWAALAVLVITGIGNLYERDESLDFLFERNFGVIFQVKMTLLVLVVILTAVHSFVIGPRLMRMQESVTDESQIASMRRWSIIISGIALLMALAIMFCGELLDSKFALE